MWKMGDRPFIEKTSIAGLFVLNPANYCFYDEFVEETYNEEKMFLCELTMKFVQENQSMSKEGVLRGLHVQKKFPQGKLVRVIDGAIYDVAVDTRTESPSYGKWYGVELSSSNKKQFYIPEGFAHGFYVLSKFATICFKVSNYWFPKDEIGIPWNDPTLNISWPIKNGNEPIVAEKDSHYEPFCLLKNKLLGNEN